MREILDFNPGIDAERLLVLLSAVALVNTQAKFVREMAERLVDENDSGPNPSR